jgi:hypothetical protein
MRFPLLQNYIGCFNYSWTTRGLLDKAAAGLTASALSRASLIVNKVPRAWAADHSFGEIDGRAAFID